ncbi:CHASE2 domain-containing protein [Roseivivax sp. THAF40]|uniref:CHASE2 domain-containing protein n=1 Tax=Roseivivax sp. THAF40 TaxID=2587858 RepID=UPI001561FE21|nr:adenylate/guanylate cyclase domain-containing protein [Roseivivax sp. THAF40]
MAATALAVWQPGARGQVGSAIEGRLLDMRFALRGPVPAPQRVAIVAFDDQAVAALQAFPPSRADIADTVRRIFAAGAEVVALDLLLVDARPDDPELSAALSLGPTLLGVAEAPMGARPTPLIQKDGFGLIIGLPSASPLPALGPNPALQQAAGLGHVTVQHDRDGMLRRMRPALSLQTPEGVVTIPGLAIAALSTSGARPELILHRDRPGGVLSGSWPTAKLDRQGALPLDYYGPEATIPTYSAAALSEADLTGRIVFLGATATGFGDRHATSFDATLPGVEAHATLAANLLEGRVLRRDLAALGIGGVLAVTVALAGFWSGSRARPWVALALSLGVISATLLALHAAFLAGWWLDALSVLAALGGGLAIGTVLRLLDTRRRAANLARFQSPRLVEAIASQTNPLGSRAPQHAIVLFVDIAGFTTRAERMGPADTARFLSMFHQQVEAAADPLGGTIMDFAGDGVLVVFGLPDAGESDAANALHFIERLFEAEALDDIHLRVGGHAGQVQFSLLGGTRHRIVSVSGDVVNTASRLQEIAKGHGVSLALSERLMASDPSTRAWADAAGLTPLVDQSLRGRQAPETIWIGMPPPKQNAAPARHMGAFPRASQTTRKSRRSDR